MDAAAAHLFVAGLLFALAGALCYVVLSGLLWGSGYMPTPRARALRALDLAQVRDGMKVYELGSGFGGVVLSIARAADVRCVGVEIDPLKSWWSRKMIVRAHMEKRATIKRANLFDVDLTDADLVFLFLMPGAMRRLEGKLHREMRPGSTVVSYWHRFADWPPHVVDDANHVFVYRV